MIENADEDKKLLPQARMYLKSAKWGFDRLLERKPSGYEYRFFMIGILAALRAVQHSLNAHDRELSPVHKEIISAWWAKTSIRDHPDLQFIKSARDQVLKAGSFETYATYSQSGIGELENLQITGTDYDLAYYDEDQERHDLGAAIESALKWCDRELSEIESHIQSRGAETV
jgi:hypothetical protein